MLMCDEPLWREKQKFAYFQILIALAVKLYKQRIA
jgi:hypothetical protein